MTASSLLFGSGAVTFSNNSAEATGSGLYVVSSSTSSVAFADSTAPVLFTRNRCLLNGGTLYWVADPGSSALISPNTPFAQRLSMAADNTAPLSPALATQATHLVSVGDVSTIAVRNYNAKLQPTPSFSLADHYGTVNVTDYSTTVLATVLPGYSFYGIYRQCSFGCLLDFQI